MSTDNKSTFSSGLIAGVAIVAIIALIIMTALYLNKDGNNAREIKEEAQVVTNNTKPTATNSVATNNSNVNIEITENDHVRGNVDAPLTIIEFSDFQCPYCARFHDTMLQVMEAFPDDVKWVYKHFPLNSIHPYAQKASEASECAAEQDKFWEYADKLNEQQSAIAKAETNNLFANIANELNLNTSQFEACLNSSKYKSKVEADLQLGKNSGVRGTPGNIINGQLIPGAIPFEQIKAMIDSL